MDDVKLNEMMLEVQKRLQRLEELAQEEKMVRTELSHYGEQVRKITEGKFQWQNRWFLVKKRGKLFYIVDYGDTEPGSWRRKKKDE